MNNVTSKVGGRETWLTETGYASSNDSEQQFEIFPIVNEFRTRQNSVWTKIFIFMVALNDDTYSLVRGNETRRPAFYTYKGLIPSTPPPVGDTCAVLLDVDDRLDPDQSIDACGFTLIYQSDGNLVLYEGGTPRWASGTDGAAPGFVIMQSDGNLVVYDGGEVPRWDSGTAGRSGAYLVITNSGTLKIVAADGVTVLWQS